MHNFTSPTPEIGDFLVWTSGESHVITRISPSHVWVTYEDREYSYPTKLIGDALSLVKSGPNLCAAVLKAPPRLTPQAHTVLTHIQKAGSITQREAIVDHSVQSLTRRITEIRDAGFDIAAEFRYHPITGQRYARYSLALANSL